MKVIERVKKTFGQPIERLEDTRLLTGRGRYTDDFEHDAAHAVFLRSDFAHARINGIDTSEAAALPGVIGVFTHADLEGDFAEPLPLLIPNDGLTEPRTQRALARDEVCYAGETVAMVVARDRYIGEDAASMIHVEYEPLPVAADLATASAGAPVAHSDMADNLAGRVSEEKGDVEAALASAPHVFEWQFRIERSASMPLEGRAVVARYDQAEDRLLLYDSTQAPTGVRAGLAMLFQMEPDHVHVVAPDIGGGFGVKVVQFYPEEVLVPWAARRLGVPVKWTEDRREHFIGSTQERGQIHDVRVGVDDDGRILAFETRFVHDVGAYCPYGLIIAINTAAQLPGPYRLANYRYDFRAIYTNTVPTSPYRGAGRPHGVFVMERVVELISRSLGLDSIEVRRRNFIGPDEFPYEVGVTYQDGGPTVYDSGDYARGLDVLLEGLDYERVRKEQAEARTEGHKVGVGIGCYVEGTGIGPYEGAVVKMQPDGSIAVATGLSSQGQGHQTMLAQIAADELGAPVESVHVVAGDTREIGYGVGTFASRSAVVAGNAVLLASREVARQARELAARILETAPDDVILENGEARVMDAPERSIGFAELVLMSNPLRYAFSKRAEAAARMAQKAYARSDRPLPEGAKPGLAAIEFYSPTSGVFAFGMHAAVVEVDPDTFDLKVRRYVLVHDCGPIINPTIVRGQIEGGVAQGIAGAFYERIDYDESGQIQNANFMDFLMPYATEIPPIEIYHTETPSPNNPLGVKGVGEAGVIPVSAVIANALEDALGIPIDRMPVSPRRLFELAQRG